MSEGTKRLWRAVERLSDSPQEVLVPALDVEAEDLVEESRASERLEPPLGRILGG